MLKWFKRKDSTQAIPVAQPAPTAQAEAPQPVTAQSQGNEHIRAGRYAEAERCYRQVMESDPQYPGALVMLGFVLREQGRIAEAREVLERAVIVAPQDADSHYLLATVLEAQPRNDPRVDDKTLAISSCRRALSLNSRLIPAQQCLSRLLLDRGQLEQAEASYRREIELTPEHFGPYHMLGVVLYRTARPAGAIEMFERAIALNPNSSASYASLAAACLDVDDTSEASLARAQANFERAVALEPGNSECHCSLGFNYWRRAERELALACFDRAIEADPNNARARWARVMLWAPAFAAKESDDAAGRAGFAVELAKFEDWWTRSDADGASFVGELQPFFLTYHEQNNLALLKQHGEICAKAMQRWLERQKPPALERAPGERIRLGLVSADVRLHSNWLALIQGWLRSFDPDRFELVVFSLSDRADAETAVARETAAVFFGAPRSLPQWVEAIREQHCDILLYPAVGLDPLTLKLASLRLAPVQINSWGHADTSGLPTIDYYLSAARFEPAGAQDHYSEKLVLLPFLGNRVLPLNLANGALDFAALNIDLGRPILVCPGTPFKYQPAHDHLFPEIAHRIPQALFVFFLRPGEALSGVLQERISAAFAAAGLEVTDHVRFIRWLSFSEFHALLRRADVMLDTIGFSGYNTAVQAMECGLPLVTREGRFLRGRLASGVLRRVDLPELIVATKAEYVDLVVRLVIDREYRARIRHEIAQRRPVLFDDQSDMGPFQDFLESTVRPVRNGALGSS